MSGTASTPRACCFARRATARSGAIRESRAASPRRSSRRWSGGRRTLAEGKGSSFDCATPGRSVRGARTNSPTRDRALDEYLAHPAMHAFEVSSTYRQFDEVLQLRRRPGGARSRGSAVAGRRAASGRRRDADRRAGGRAGRPRSVRPMLLRVSDPEWKPGGRARSRDPGPHGHRVVDHRLRGDRSAD